MLVNTVCICAIYLFVGCRNKNIYIKKRSVTLFLFKIMLFKIYRLFHGLKLLSNLRLGLSITLVKCLTCCGAVVRDVAGHVYGSAVDAQVSHAAHKVSVPHGEILGQVGNTA